MDRATLEQIEELVRRVVREELAAHKRPNVKINSELAGMDTGEVVVQIPLAGGGEFPVRRPFVEELDKLYPAVDPEQTLREIRGWCLGNPTRRKTERGVRAFITTWFRNEQDRQSRRA